AQTTEALTRLGASLKAAGFDYKDVVAVDVFITDVARFNDMNDGYRPFFQTDPPVRATVGVDRFASPTTIIRHVLTAAKKREVEARRILMRWLIRAAACSLLVATATAACAARSSSGPVVNLYDAQREIERYLTDGRYDADFRKVVAEAQAFMER